MRLITIRGKIGWSLLGTFVSGLVALVWLPLDAFRDVTQELIALFGLMMAGVLPTMVLTASSLRAGDLSVKKLMQYRDALRQQMLVWVGLFLISLVASLLVIIGKMTDWHIPIALPFHRLDPLGAQIPDWTLELVRALNACVTMALAIVLFRSIAVANGILSLLGLSAELAIGEARARENARHEAAEKALSGMPEREGFGKYVDRPH